ncbi:hypothetical protein TNCV_4857201 [Trichonephila clavipes]|uniref:Transposase n=1 Tax=Trichonephila clavipes TaxID=2585209 RepID=A0A8X6RGC5_TRICX|nr:hypothetical protein TNCV_4857201 [Trichonephila clavipes]
MITNFFIPELNNHDVQELWFQQDGATCHTARARIDLLKDTLGDRLIHSLVYADKPQTLDHLEDNTRRVIADIRLQMLEKVIENWTSPDWTTSEPAVAVLCQKSYLKYNLVALHFKYDQARRRFVEWAQNEIAVVPDFHKRILFSDEAHFWLNGYVNKQNCRIWSEANPQVNVETPLHPEKLTVWCALWAGGILLQKR